MVVHLSTASHQLAFLAQAKPELYLQFAAHSSTSTETWDKATLDKLDSVVCICKMNSFHFFYGDEYFRWRDWKWCGKNPK